MNGHPGFLRAMAGIGLALLLSTVGGNDLLAQRFMHHYGGTCSEDGYSVRIIPAGGYVLAGATTSPSGGPNCLGTLHDVYVVKVNDKGTVVWARAYNLGGDDVAQDVYVCSNGDFAITGYTKNNSRVCFTHGSAEDAFILRITSTGSVSWCSVYGGSLSEAGMSITEAAYAQSSAVAVGDLIVAGSHWNPANVVGSRDAYIIRANGTNGALRWASVYGGAQDDQFYGVTECRKLGLPSNVNRGDIIAAGYSKSFNATGSASAFICRVDGPAGGFTGVMTGAVTYGGPTDEAYLYAVDEQGVGLEAGHVVYTGAYRIPGFGGHLDAYVLKTTAWPCRFDADRRIGDNGSLRDESYSIKEIDLTTGSGLTRGNLYIAGVTNQRSPLGYFADGFIQELNPSTLVPINAFHVYGGPGTEWFTHLEPVATSAGSRTAGVIASGIALRDELPNPPNYSQAWLTKTDNVLSANCCDTTMAVVNAALNLFDSCLAIEPTSLGSRCTIAVDTIIMTGIDTLCNDSLNKTRSCPGPIIPPGFKAPEEEHPQGLASVGSGAAATIREGIVSSYPNPVTSGSILNVTYGLAKEGELTVTVSDVAGRIIHRSTERYAAGTILMPIETDRWRPGTYLIEVSSATSSSTRRVVVSER